MARLSILYFAWVRELIGHDGDEIDRPEPGTRITDLIATLAARDAGHAQALSDPAKLRAALDQHFVPLDALIGNARELAIFPPVTGG